MSDKFFTPDEAIETCIRDGIQGISVGLAKKLQAERDSLRAALAEKEKEMREELDHWKSEHYRVHCLNQVMLTHDQVNELIAAQVQEIKELREKHEHELAFQKANEDETKSHALYWRRLHEQSHSLYEAAALSNSTLAGNFAIRLDEERKTIAAKDAIIAEQAAVIEAAGKELVWIVGGHAKYHTEKHCSECPCSGCHETADSYARAAGRILASFPAPKPAAPEDR